MSGRTLHAALIASARAHPKRIAFRYFDPAAEGWTGISYGRFAAMAGAAARTLMDAGVRPGGRVALIADSGASWCAAYLGTLMAGAVSVPIDVHMTRAEAANILRDSETSAILTGDESAATAQEAATGLGVRVIHLSAIDWGIGGIDWVEKGEPPMAPALAAGSELDGVASLLYTSGTTGAPKAVMLTHENFLSDVDALAGAELISESDNIISVLPLHHTYAFTVAFLLPLLTGASITYPRALKGPEIMAASQATGGTVLVGVPQILDLMRNRIAGRIGSLPAPARLPVKALVRAGALLRRATGMNLIRLVIKNPMGPRFRFLASGGARLAPDVMRGLESFGFTVVEGYGLTETAPVVAFNPPGRRKPGSVGRALPPAEIRILDPSPSGGEGEIAIRGPMVMKGYYRRPEATRDALREGWFRSGDMGCIDPEGYVFITGRIKEIIVLSSGKNVYPEEVEARFLDLPLVKEICVVEHQGGLRAVIVPDPDRAKEARVGNIQETLKWEIGTASASLPPHMRPTGFTLVNAPLPRTPLGKLRRFKVREMLAGEKVKTGPHEAQAAPWPGLADDGLGRALAAALKPLIAEGTQIAPGSSLELDLGLDSLKRLELAVSLEEALGLKIPDEALSEVHTVGELIESLREGLAEAAEGGGAVRGMGRDALGAVLDREPSAEEMDRIGLSAGTPLWPALGAVHFLRVYFGLLHGLRVEGAENIPEPPFIMAANHSSYYDAFVMAASLPRRVLPSIYFQGASSFFDGPLSSYLARLAHVIPIDPDASLGGALRLSSHVLRSGRALFVFPEGGRTFDGSVMPFKKGVGILAMKFGVPVVPVHIRGSFAAYPRHNALPRPGRISVAIGRPLAPRDWSRRAEDKDSASAFAAELYRRVAAL